MKINGRLMDNKKKTLVAALVDKCEVQGNPPPRGRYGHCLLNSITKQISKPRLG